MGTLLRHPYSSAGSLRLDNAARADRIKRQDVEARVLRAMRERFFEPAAFAAFCEGFSAEMELQRREHLKRRAGARRELETVEREIRKIIDAIKAGVPLLSIKDELEALETRKAALKIASAETPVPALHLHMAEVFRQKTTAIAAGLEQRRPARRRTPGAPRVP
jgi:site-specific DNA recombinase